MNTHRLSPFGPIGEMDGDGYSVPCTYAEKAAIERRQLAEIDLRIARAIRDGQHNDVVATRAYADDLRARIRRFEALADDAPDWILHQAA